MGIQCSELTYCRNRHFSVLLRITLHCKQAYYQLCLALVSCSNCSVS